MMTDYLSSSNSPCNYEMAKENRKKSPRKESLVHTLRPSLAAPFTGTLGISRHWQVGIGRPRQGSLLGLPSVIMRHCKTLAQSSTLLSRRVCNPFTQAHHRVSKLKQKMCILRKQRGYNSECSSLVLKTLDEPPRWQLMVNSVGFVISKEDLTSRPGTRLDHSRAFV